MIYLLHQEELTKKPGNTRKIGNRSNGRLFPLLYTPSFSIIISRMVRSVCTMPGLLTLPILRMDSSGVNPQIPSVPWSTTSETAKKAHIMAALAAVAADPPHPQVAESLPVKDLIYTLSIWENARGDPWDHPGGEGHCTFIVTGGFAAALVLVMVLSHSQEW